MPMVVLVLEMGAELSGVHWKGAPLPVENYEIHLKAKEQWGVISFAA